MLSLDSTDTKPLLNETAWMLGSFLGVYHARDLLAFQSHQTKFGTCHTNLSWYSVGFCHILAIGGPAI